MRAIALQTVRSTRARAGALALLASTLLAGGSARAQTPADLEPGVDTSRPGPEDATPGARPPVGRATAAVPGAAADRAKSAPPAAAAAAERQGAAEAGTTRSAKDGKGGKGGKGGKALDRLDLDTTQITGNRELPKVLYIVPWKRAELGDLTGKPPNSLVDEVLQPIDRDVFRRQNRYYQALQPDAAPGSRPPVSGGTDVPGAPR